jgi:murein DD-endopeptidase MepM/ murein hydrolase activator NlpD
LKKHRFWGFLSFLVGVALLSLISLVPVFFEYSEINFLSPLNPDGSQANLIRNDDRGKGHFGASRNGNRLHKGVDLKAPIGTPIHASKSGRIIKSLVKGGYGEFVEIAHPDGTHTRYAHLSERLVQGGDWVWQGACIGKVGTTGNARYDGITSHLHFEVRRGSEALDPGSWLTLESPDDVSLRDVKS